MIRIQPISKDTTCEKQQAILTTVQKAKRGVLNLFSTIAQSPAFAAAHLDFRQAHSQDSLPAKW